MALHIIKLCVGCDTIEELLDWRRSQAGDWRVHTRQTPKRADEVLDGGSLYRVFKGLILCRQAILDIETVGEGQAARCQMVVSEEIVRVAPTPRRAFQGWRYFRTDEAPPDLELGGDDSLPSELAARLRAAGAW